MQQDGPVSREEIDKTYDKLFLVADQFLKELHQRQEQQRTEEEEAAKLKKLREEQVRWW